MRRPAILASLLLVVSSAAAAQESVLLRMGGRQGQVNRYQSSTETFMRPGQMAAMMSSDTTLPFMRMTMLMTRTLSSVSGDTLTFVEVVDSAAMETPAAPQMSGMMGGMAGQMRGQTTTQKMNRRARILSSEVTGGMAAMGGRGMGGMAGRNERPIFLLPEGAVRVGESWTDTSTTAATATEGVSVFEATFKLERIMQQGGSRIAVVSANGTRTSAMPQGPQNFSISGEFQFDLTGGRLANATMNMSGIIQSREGPMPVRMVMIQTLTP